MFNSVQIVGSLCRYFEQFASERGLPFFSEGFDDPESQVWKVNNLCLRIDGPYLNPNDSGGYINVQILLTEIGPKKNGYTLIAFADEAANALKQAFPVWDIPTQPTQQLGCLFLDGKRKPNPQIINLNQQSSHAKVYQIYVAARLFYEG